MDHAAEDLALPQTRRVWFDCRIRPSSQAQRGLLLQATVRPMPVVVEDVLGQDLLEMAATEDEKPVQALAACGANKALRDKEFALGARTGVFTIRMPSARNTSSKPTVNFVSRSRMRNLTGRERSASTKLRLRAAGSPTARSGRP